MKLHDGLKKIGERAFSYTGIEEIEIPSSIETIVDRAFSTCTKLQRVKFNNGLREIQTYAFCDTDLLEVDLPETLRLIQGYAFAHCIHLKHIRFNSVIDKIDYNAFYNISSKPVFEMPKGSVYHKLSLPRDCIETYYDNNKSSLSGTATKALSDRQSEFKDSLFDER